VWAPTPAWATSLLARKALSTDTEPLYGESEVAALVAAAVDQL
jgi:hypothetical protein